MSEQDIQTNINDDLLTEANYEKVAAKYRLIFEKIAEGTLAREQQRALPYEQINWLKQVGFGALRVPVKFGGDGVSLPQLFQLLIDRACQSRF
ncbi:MAG: hypothetical protein GAK29_05061 [Acinetobacter bereziniae]|uniref:Uncharacterized protein n=1 Tax=Acinetobacter bereziniae TaxID=106648 RepID=A0A833P8M5_ACIBZ|nr:MAG: hypothetical protein GAK29_05061 [Acinetobacter bereziniae]